MSITMSNVTDAYRTFDPTEVKQMAQAAVKATRSGKAQKQAVDTYTPSAEEVQEYRDIADRISEGINVNYADEKKLVNYNADMYQVARKEAAALANQGETGKAYDEIMEMTTKDLAEETTGALPKVEIDIGA